MDDNNNELSSREKLKIFDDWMRGDHILIHVDSRRSDVEVPESCRNNYALVLKLSYLFSGETARDDSGISAYLKFSGQYEKCVIPWTAIWGITSSDGQQKIWPKELPPELVVQLAVKKLKEVGKKVLRRKPEEEGPETEPPKPRARGNLRRIK